METTSEISGQRAEECWALDELAIELRTAAVQRNVMLWAEFDAVLLDPRVTKYVAVDETANGRCCALLPELAGDRSSDAAACWPGSDRTVEAADIDHWLRSHCG